MREIKFRAWHKNLHIMLPCGEIAAEVNPYDQIVLPDILKRDCYELMQYTGLKDKNGTEIYEGDVVRSNMAVPITVAVAFDRGKSYHSTTHIPYHTYGRQLPCRSGHVSF